MKKAIDWIRSNLAVKQFVVILSVISFVFSGLAWNNLRDSQQLMRRQAINEADLMVKQTNQLLDSYLDTMFGVSNVIISNSDLFELGSRDEIVQKLIDFSANSGTFVNTLYYIRGNESVYSSKQTMYEILGNDELIRLNSAFVSRNNTFSLFWSEPYYNFEGKTVAFMRRVIHDKQPSGTAVIELNIHYLTAMMKKLFQQSTETFILMTSNGNVVAADLDHPMIPTDYKDHLLVVRESFSDMLSRLPNGINEIEHHEKKMVVIKSDQNRLNWSYMIILDEHSFYEEVYTLRKNFFAAGLAGLVLLTLTIFLLSRYTTHGIRRLTFMMNRFNVQEPKKIVTTKRKDEIGMLMQSYNALIERLHTSIEEVKQIEKSKKNSDLKMLQSQIGPHFLYNTLMCISSLARQHKHNEVRATIHSLINLIAFSFNKKSEWVTLEEEIEVLKMYEQIQKVRYGGQFDIQYMIDESLLSCKIPKLLLQPIVENAIYHGIVPKDMEGNIQIMARKDRGMIKIYVIDDGIGMNDHHAVWHTKVGKSAKNAFNHLGIRNVHERIQNYYGEQYGLKLFSKKGKGTVVRMTIPYRT